MAGPTGETLQERTKGKDVRTSNIVAAKVRLGYGFTVGEMFLFVTSFLFRNLHHQMFLSAFINIRLLPMQYERLWAPEEWISCFNWRMGKFSLVTMVQQF
jgi:hypothetical protein